MNARNQLCAGKIGTSVTGVPFVENGKRSGLSGLPLARVVRADAGPQRAMDPFLV